MKIAQVAPLYESVPPKFYGGTERIVSYLTEALVRDGHEVTLFASGDSETAADLVPCCEQGLRLDSTVTDAVPYHFLMIEEVFRRASEFDVIHFHIDYLHFPWSVRQRITQLTTLHGRLDLPFLPAIFRQYRSMPVVSISDAQREPLPSACWQATVYHGLPPDLYECSERPGSYLAFVGRISPEKGLEMAIEIAKESGIPLRIAAKVDPDNASYYEDTIKPLLEHPLIEFGGEIGEAEKGPFLQGALGLLFPIAWPEPFGLVMIEAMACGTPVIAFPQGSVPEVMEHGKTGYIVTDVEQAIARVRDLASFRRQGCREVFDQRFTAARMAQDYLNVYRRLAGGHIAEATS